MKAARLLKERLSGAGAATGADGAASSGVEEVDDAASLKAAREMRVVCLVNLSLVRLRQERPEDALEACDTAIALDDEAGKAWYRRGQACMAMGQYAAARKNLARAAHMIPNSKEIREEHAKAQAALDQAAAEKKSAFG
jgi:peptidyl-prolyl isomerase D